MRCSQLSRISSIGRSDNASRNRCRSSTLIPDRINSGSRAKSPKPSTAPIAASTSPRASAADPSARTDASSTRTTGWCRAIRAPSSLATRVFPVPPGPSTVVTRELHSSCSRAIRSSARPSSAFGAARTPIAEGRCTCVGSPRTTDTVPSSAGLLVGSSRTAHTGRPPSAARCTSSPRTADTGRSSTGVCACVESSRGPAAPVGATAEGDRRARSSPGVSGESGTGIAAAGPGRSDTRS